MAERPKYGEPDYGPLFLFSVLGIAVGGIYAGSEFFKYLRGRRLSTEPTPEPPPDGDDGKPTS
jgi:hypothetical protein